jgi:hypothetical protein
VPFYVDAEQYERWNRPSFQLDLVDGATDSFSLEAGDGVHFVSRTPACARPRSCSSSGPVGAPGPADGATPAWRDGPPPATLEAMTRHVRTVAWAVVALLVLALAASLVLEAFV